MLETQPKLMTVNEVARELRLHPVTVYRKIKDDDLQAFRLVGSSRLRIPAEAVDAQLTKPEQKEEQ